MLIFDAHLDLSLNALEYNRDLTQSITEIRAGEQGMIDLAGRERGTVCFPAMRQANVGICVATLLAGCMKPAGPVGSWNSPAQAWAMTRGQLAWYRGMEDQGELRSLCTWEQVQTHIDEWTADPNTTPIGYILSLEGADSLRTLDDLETNYAQGLRALGPAHYGKGRYALGHDQSGPLSPAGRDLLREMDGLGMILDVTHLCEETFWQALELYDGPVWASHHNCRALVDDPRQLSNEQIIALTQRGGVIGVAFDVWMVIPGWTPRRTRHEQLPGGHFAALAEHVDHIAQLTGDCTHIGIGSDLDGGFGNEQSPSDLDTIADLVKFHELLAARGYSETDLAGLCHGNFLNLLRRAWP